jgi:signal transduction histidine kinase
MPDNDNTVKSRLTGMSLPLSDDDNDQRPLLGVGISGMRERVRNLGGQMQIRSGSWGTAVEVLFPIEENAPAAQAASVVQV